MSHADIGPASGNGILRPCRVCQSTLCDGSGPHANEWDSPAVEWANLQNESTRVAAQEQAANSVCAECGSRLLVVFQAVYQSGYRLRCTEDVQHEGTILLADVAQQVFGLPEEVARKLTA